jgi:N-carbamoyl-L-amino-acid hydrolase
MLSGAIHDASIIGKLVPTAMLFVPSRDGISHDEAEWTEPAHLEAGANVLLHAMLARAGVASGAAMRDGPSA